MEQKQQFNNKKKPRNNPGNNNKPNNEGSNANPRPNNNYNQNRPQGQNVQTKGPNRNNGEQGWPNKNQGISQGPPGLDNHNSRQYNNNNLNQNYSNNRDQQQSGPRNNFNQTQNRPGPRNTIQQNSQNQNNFQPGNNFNQRRNDNGPSNSNRTPGNVSVLKGQVPLKPIKKAQGSLPDRPGFLTSGAKVELVVNCWDLQIKPVDVIMYDFEVTSAKYVNLEGLKVREKDLKDFKKYIPDHFHSGLVHDGGKILYSFNAIPGVDKKNVVKKCIIPDPLGRDDVEVSFTIKKVQEVSTTELINHVNKKLKTSSYPMESIRFLDCVFRSILGKNSPHVVRNSYFSDKEDKQVNGKLMNLHRGMSTSIRPQWKIRINVNMRCKAFFPPGKLSDVLYRVYGDEMYDKKLRQIQNDLRHIKAICSYNKDSNGKPYKKKVTIHGLSRNPCNREVIPDIKKNIADYFKDHYGITLEYPYLPAVKVNPKRDIFIPMELLEILPFQAPNESQATIAGEIVRCAAVKPQERFNKLDNYIRDLCKIKNNLTDANGISINPEKVKVTGHVLACPENFQPGCWRQNKFCEPAMKSSQIKWAIVSLIAPNRGYADKRDPDNAEQGLASEGAKMGLKFGKALKKTCTIAEMKNFFNDAKKQGISLVVIILYDTFNYGMIKYLGDLQIGIVTQCVKPMTLKKNPYSNLLLKINAKLGGLNWVVPYSKPKEELIQVFGMDVTHPTGVVKNGVKKSIAAVSASISENLMKYSVIISEQLTSDPERKAVKEIIEQLDVIIFKLINMCAEENGRLPSRLIFYRDGCSEGQFQTVVTNELGMIQKACTKIKPGYEPGITFITVQKRHQVRFMKSADKTNLDPGTVIDTEVVHPREFDFYLCSHRGIQGTSSPSHYYILYDDNDWDPESLMNFTYSLCYAYVRCTMSVSIPAPTYYSHHAAFRARDWKEHIGKEIKNGIFQINSAQERAMFFV